MERTWIALTIFLAVVSNIALAQSSERNVTVVEGLSVSVPKDWQVGNKSRDALELYLPRKEALKEQPRSGDKNPKPEFVVPPDAGMLITVEHRRDHAEALKRLAEIVNEYPEPASYLVIAGWPAIERTYRSYEPQPGESEESSGNIQTTFTTTAIAVGTMVIRFNTMYAPEVGKKLIPDAIGIAHKIKVQAGPADASNRELRQIKSLTSRPNGMAPSHNPDQRTLSRGKGPLPGVPVQVQTGVGELEIATDGGQHVVIAANSGFSFSDNAGGSYTFGGGTPCNQTWCDGDPSLAVGQSGAIYYSWIGGPTTSQLGDGVSRSTDNGHTFPFRAMMVNCPGTTSCSTADQEHIAADRYNAGSGGDRVYNVWRNFTVSGGGAFSIRITCSKDGGSTWSSSVVIGTGDFPRVAVGPDGFVYVAWASGGNMMLNKLNNCDAASPLAAQAGWPVTVSAFTNVVCPVPGLDRCNGRNILSSPVVAPDDLDANHIFYSFTTSSGAGNENVMIMDSNDGGATFPHSVQANSATTARRYLSWLSVYGGTAVVSWYDRRNATAANNDRARYFIGGAAVRGPNLVALNETDLSGADDNQCATWPWPTNATTDSESCSSQPQLAGYCATAATTSPPLGYTACDFTSTVCGSGMTCKNDRGAPKYGDYNGNAAGGGLMFSAWASTVPPAGVGGAGGTLRVYSSADRIPSDFYVRDWNNGASFDNGQQPSTHADFWSTSDVWNQDNTTPEAAGPGGWIVGDPPNRAGSNYLFARISRRASAVSTAPVANVTANFFVADYGLNMPFSSVGSQTVNLGPADMNAITPALSWTVPASSSNHLCAAVQITGPDGDVSGVGSLDGTPAGTGVVIDNNVAQRNLLDTIGTASGTEIISAVGTLFKKTQPMRLRVQLPKNARLPGTIDVLGGKERVRTVKIGNNAVIDLGPMRPGERRWLRIHIASLVGVDKPIALQVFDTSPPGNGITMLVHLDSIQHVVIRNLKSFGGVMLRLAEVEHDEDAKKLAELALQSAREGSNKIYLEFLRNNRKLIESIVNSHLKKMGGDQFGVRAAVQGLWAAADKENADSAAASLAALTERTDAQMSAWMYTHR